MAFICKIEFGSNFTDSFPAVLQTMYYQACYITGNILLHCFAGMLLKITTQVCR